MMTVQCISEGVIILKDVKIKPTMEKPKLLEKVNILPREAGAIMKERYMSKLTTQTHNNPTATNAASNDAIDGIETNSKNAASYASRKGVEHLKKSRTKSESVVQKNPADDGTTSNAPKTRTDTASAAADPKRAAADKLKKANMKESSLPQNGGELSHYEGNDTSLQTAQAKREFQRERLKKRQENTKLQHATEQRNNADIRSKNADVSFDRKKSASGGQADNKALTKRRQDLSNQKQSSVRQAVGTKNNIKHSTGAYRTEKKTAQAKSYFTNLNKSAQQRAKARAVKKAQKEMAKRSAQTAKKVAKETVTIAKKVTVAIAKAAAALVKGAVALLGGVGALIAIVAVIAVVAAVIASPFGLFFSGEDSKNPDTVPVSSVVAQLNTELGNKLEQIQSETTHDNVEIHGHIANWAEVLAVFAVKTASGDDATMMDVVTIDSKRADLLKQVFWDMNSLRHDTTSTTTGEGEDAVTTVTLHIYIDCKTYLDMITAYNFNAGQIEALNGMLEYRDMLIALAGSVDIDSADALEIMERLPPDLSTERRAVVKTACSLVGKVNYFWGGKSEVIGWDSRWGTPMKVTADGSSSTGTIRPYGLDCSGFVTWVFVNAGFSANDVGHGVIDQNAHATTVSWDDAQPGDLAVYGDESHVGIVAGRDENGNILVIHCASGHNNVVITGVSGFGHAARPGAYN